MQGSRAASAGVAARRRGARPAPPRGRPTAPSAAAWRPSARARPRPGWRRPAPSRAEPAVEAAPGRQHERDAARRQAAAVQLRRPAADVVHLRLRAAAPPAASGEALQPAKRVAVERERARGEAALDLEVLQMAGDVGVARRRRRRRGSRRPAHQPPAAGATAPRWRPRRCAPGSRCPCRRCSASGRARRAPAGRRRRRSALVAQRDQRDDSACAGSSSHCTASKPALAPQYGAPRLAAKLFASSLDAAGERQRGERLGAAPDADRRLRNQELVLQLAHQHVGQVGGVGGEHQRARPAVQLVGDRDVVLAVADHLDDLPLEALDLVAQHFHLPLLQRHRALAVRAGQLDRAEQLGVALEEAGAGGQVVGDVGLGDALHAGRSVLIGAHRSLS